VRRPKPTRVAVPIEEEEVCSYYVTLRSGLSYDKMSLVKGLFIPFIYFP